MKDWKENRDYVLRRTLKTCCAQLVEAAQTLEDLIAIVPFAKSPKDRTSVNIVIDDQRKVQKALSRLQNDVSGLLDDT